MMVEHRLIECVDHVVDSPAACRRVLQALTALAEGGSAFDDPRWASTVRAAAKLTAAINGTRDRSRW